MANEGLAAAVAAGLVVVKAIRAPMVTKLTHMVHTAEFVSKRRPSQIRMSVPTLNGYFKAMKPGWSGRDWDGIPIILDDSLEYCKVGILFDVGSEE